MEVVLHLRINIQEPRTITGAQLLYVYNYLAHAPKSHPVPEHASGMFASRTCRPRHRTCRAGGGAELLRPQEAG